MSLFLTALGLGLIFSAAPGAVFAETVRRGLAGGYRAALAVQLGSLAGDALWALLGLAGLGLLLQMDSWRGPVSLAGAGYLLWLAWEAWQAAGRPARAAGGAPVRRALWAGGLLSLTNPQNIAYWAALGNALDAVGVARPTPWDYGLFFGGFMTAAGLWAFLAAGLVTTVFGRAGGAWARWVYRLCALAFGLLALATLRPLLWPAS